MPRRSQRKQTAMPGPLEIEGASEPEPEYPTGIKFAVVVMALGLSLVITGLDNSILATAVPAITNHYKTIADVGWYYSAYRLTSCAFQFMFGKMYTVYSIKGVFLIALLIFEVGSLLSATAPTSAALVVGRAVSGFGCAGIVAGVFTMITHTTPLRQRPVFGGVAAGIEGIAATSAPLLGGLITDKISWRWCFYINLPLGAFTLIAVGLFFENPQTRRLPNLSPKEKMNRLDLLSTAIFVPWIVSLLLALQWGGSKYGWNNARIIALLALGGILVALFVWLQWRNGDDALLPPRIIGQRSILSGMWFVFCNSSTLSIIEYYMPIYFQAVKEVSASKSGVLVLPTVIALTISVLFSGSAVSIIGYYAPFMLLTSILTPVATGLLTTLEVDAVLARLICYQALLGFGCGIGYQGPQSAAQTVLSPQDSAIGIALIQFANSFGPAIFVSVAQTIFAGHLTADLAKYAPELDVAALDNMGLSDLKRQFGPEDLAGALMGYDKAVRQMLYLGVALTCLSSLGSVGMEWRSVKRKQS